MPHGYAPGMVTPPLPRSRLPVAPWIALGLTLGLVTGCAVGRFTEGNRLPLERIEQIEPGATTKQEILTWFGPPQNYTEGSILEQIIVSDEIMPGSVAPYRFSDVLAYQFHEGRASALFLLLFNYIRIEVDSDHLVVFFDENDVVRYYGVRRRDDDE